MMEDDTQQSDNLNLDCSSSFPPHEADTDSSEQLMDSECASVPDSCQSSVLRLRKQMEMLARDEDIPVHCNIAAEDDDSDFSHSEFVINEIDCGDSAACSLDSAAVLPSSDVDDVDNSHQDVRPKNQHHFEDTSLNPSRDTLVSGDNTDVKSAEVIDSAMSLTAAAEMAHLRAVNGEQRRRKVTETEKLRDEVTECDECRCDCCSVLTHQKDQIHSDANVDENKLAVTFVGRLVSYLLLFLLLVLLLFIICSMKPGWCRVSLLVDWHLQHVGGTPPV